MIGEPKPTTGTSAQAAWFRQLLDWIRGWRVLSIEGYREEQSTSGRNFKRTFQLAPGKTGTSSTGNFNMRGLYVPGTAYALYDAVILQTGTATGVYWSLAANNTNAPDSGTGWMQVATVQGQWL